MTAYSALSKRSSTDRRRRDSRWVRLRLLCGGGVAGGAAAAGGVVVAASAAVPAASTAPGRRVPVPRPAGGRPAPGPAAGTVRTASVSRLGPGRVQRMLSIHIFIAVGDVD